MTEIEFESRFRQCLDRCIDSSQQLEEDDRDELKKWCAGMTKAATQN